MYSPQATFFSELFGTSVRYTGASVGYQLASILAGALAPIIALQLLGSTDEKNTGAVAVYLAVAAAITVVSVLLAKETKATSLRHDRVLDGPATDLTTSARPHGPGPSRRSGRSRRLPGMARSGH
ncbi:hypothetical protein LG324_19090 [Phycicoccus jejuensis]|uniref:hypothetical protein n=1 Tax=Phycicoccus jejuensis TaxID=367299 RepID=UPI00384F6CAC